MNRFFWILLFALHSLIGGGLQLSSALLGPVLESLALAENPTVENPTVENPTVENPTVENPTLEQRNIVVSIAPLSFFAKALLPGELQGDIKVLFSPNGCIEDIEPSLAQVRAVRGADLVVLVGDPKIAVEQQIFDKLLSPIQREHTLKIYREDIPELSYRHIWLSPAGGRAIAEEMASFFAKNLPSYREEITNRKGDLIKTINELDLQLRKVFSEPRLHEPRLPQPFVLTEPTWAPFLDAYQQPYVVLFADEVTAHHDTSAKSLMLARDQLLTANANKVFTHPGFPIARLLPFISSGEIETIVLDPLRSDWDANLREVAAQLVKAPRREGLQKESWPKESWQGPVTEDVSSKSSNN